jgi:MinD superfamily P-loop ATPase
LTFTELPLLNDSLCTGCGDCVPACPADCLAMAGSVPWLPRPGACISCALCTLICPTSALTMEADQSNGN